MREITKIQHDTLNYIKYCIQEYDNTPSFQMVCNRFNLKSKYAAQKRYHALIKKGYLENVPEMPGKYRLRR